MISVHLLSPEKVHEQLESLGCKFIEQIDENTQGWETSWGFAFTVPSVGPDKWCPKFTLYEILADIERFRPKH